MCRCCGSSRTFGSTTSAAPSRTPCAWGRSGSTPSSTLCGVASTTGRPTSIWRSIRTCRSPAWPRPRPRTTWHSWGPSDDETDPVAGRPSQGPAPAHLFTRIRQSGAARCPGRPGLSPLPVPPLRARAPRSRAARRRASHQGRQVPGLKKSRDLRVPCDPVIEQAPRAGAGPLGVSRPPRERVGVGQLRHGQDASRARVGARGLSARLSGPLHHRRRAGERPARGPGRPPSACCACRSNSPSRIC